MHSFFQKEDREGRNSANSLKEKMIRCRVLYLYQTKNKMHRSSGIAQFILMINDWANKSVIGINA